MSKIAEIAKIKNPSKMLKAVKELTDSEQSELKDSIKDVAKLEEMKKEQEKLTIKRFASFCNRAAPNYPQGKFEKIYIMEGSYWGQLRGGGKRVPVAELENLFLPPRQAEALKDGNNKEQKIKIIRAVFHEISKKANKPLLFVVNKDHDEELEKGGFFAYNEKNELVNVQFTDFIDIANALDLIQ